MTISDINRALARLLMPAREVQSAVQSTLDPFCLHHKYPSLSRIKSEASLSQKIETGRYKNLLEVDDIVAFTIIIPTAAHEKRCIDFLSESFNLIEVRDRTRSTTNPQQFSFDATRAYLRLKPPAWEEDKEKVKYEIIFEIQIQTALEHAWITATHDVVYKSSRLNWQKLRLAAQIKAQIEVVDLIFRNFEQVASSMEDREWRDGVQAEKVTNLFDSLAERKVIPSEKMPYDKIRLAQNALKLLSKSSLNDLDQTLEKIASSFDDIGREGFPQNLTLIQVFMVAATRCGCQSNPDRRFTPHITDSLIKMFPELKSWNVMFSYNEI